MISKLKGPWRITFDTNPEDCNLLCIMCERYDNLKNKKNVKTKKRRMSPLLIEKIVEQGFQMGELKEIIPSTMGEPLLYSYFDTFIKLCKVYDLNLNLTTNGTFPRKNIEEWAHLLLPICSDIKISWNGFTKETDELIMRGKNHDLVKQNLENLLRIRNDLVNEGMKCSTITLQLTFMELNYKEIPDIIRMAVDLGVERVKGHHIWTHNQQAEKWSMRRSENSRMKWNEIVLQANNLVKRRRENDEKSIKLDNFHSLSNERSDILLENSICPFLGREAWVSAEGRFSPCCAPDILRQELGDFGNLKEFSLAEIWNSKKYANLCKNYEDNVLCKNCNMRKKQENVYT